MDARKPLPKRVPDRQRVVNAAISASIYPDPQVMHQIPVQQAPTDLQLYRVIASLRGDLEPREETRPEGRQKRLDWDA